MAKNAAIFAEGKGAVHAIKWAGTAYEGSSLRGALSGFFRNGVCRLDLSPDDGSDEWVLTYEINKDARENRLGAYYRLQADLSDFHVALQEVGVIYASAQIHENWKEPTDGEIAPSEIRSAATRSQSSAMIRLASGS